MFPSHAVPASGTPVCGVRRWNACGPSRWHRHNSPAPTGLIFTPDLYEHCVPMLDSSTKEPRSKRVGQLNDRPTTPLYS